MTYAVVIRKKGWAISRPDDLIPNVGPVVKQTEKTLVFVGRLGNKTVRFADYYIELCETEAEANLRKNELKSFLLFKDFENKTNAANGARTASLSRLEKLSNTTR